MILKQIISVFREEKINFKSLIYKERHYLKNMDCLDLRPPKIVRGMKNLERNLFCKTVSIPQLKVPELKSNKILPLLRKIILKMEKLKPVRSASRPDEKVILLHPLVVKDWESLPINQLSEEGLSKNNFYFGEIELNYENWKADEIFKAILPQEKEAFSSYSKIGHIIHINLRDHLLPYKELIGKVLLDKIPGCKTVVNKTSLIDNTYRNFCLELVCGEENYCVTTKENGITFEFDFSKVYWNPRLSTEHERIVKLLKTGDILYDVFAGVGPFSVPAAKKKCIVLSNDLNPESFKWLNVNIKRNKCTPYIKTFNDDGKNFILKEIKNDLVERLSGTDNEFVTRNIHITMNLPAMAVEFLNLFQGLLRSREDLKEKEWNLPLVHVYCFIKGEHTNSSILQHVEKHAGFKIGNILDGIHFVRNVAPNKDMYRVSFKLSKEILFSNQTSIKRIHSGDDDDASIKKFCN